jgi:hypothetical protein
LPRFNPIEVPADVDRAHQLVAEGRAHWNGGKPTGAERPAKISGKTVSSIVLGPAVTLYLDTSSVVKLYVTEAGSEVVRQPVGDATVVATSVVAYAEMRAALVRLRREGALTASKFRIAKRELPSSRLRQHPPGSVRRGLPAGDNRRHAVLQLR